MRKEIIERRRSQRYPTAIKAEIAEKPELIPLGDISFRGALLRMHYPLQSSTILSMKMHLPIDVDPLEMKARVIRVVRKKSFWRKDIFETGVEILI